MAREVRSVERIVAARGRGAHGVVTRSGLLAAGLTSDEIRSRRERGALIEVHRGVYRVGHDAPSAEATLLAAVLACGAGSLLGGAAAAWLAGIVRGAQPPPTVWSPTERRVPGVRCRRGRTDFAEGAWEVRGVPVVAVARMLVELAADLSAGDLARACHEAGVRYRTTPAQVAAVLAPNAEGARRLRAVLAGDEQPTLSRLESGFRRMLREHGLPLPDTNKVASGRRVDCRWPHRRLTVELDSYAFHNSRHAWQQDRRREREAYARGDEFRRYTWADVYEDSRAMLVELRALLS